MYLVKNVLTTLTSAPESIDQWSRLCSLNTFLYVNLWVITWRVDRNILKGISLIEFFSRIIFILLYSIIIYVRMIHVNESNDPWQVLFVVVEWISAGPEVVIDPWTSSLFTWCCLVCKVFWDIYFVKAVRRSLVSWNLQFIHQAIKGPWYWLRSRFFIVIQSQTVA